jgi:subtilisin family serine protease
MIHSSYSRLVTFLLAGMLAQARSILAETPTSSPSLPKLDWHFPEYVYANPNSDEKAYDSELMYNLNTSSEHRGSNQDSAEPKITLNWIHRQSGKWIYGSRVDLDNDNNNDNDNDDEFENFGDQPERFSPNESNDTFADGASEELALTNAPKETPVTLSKRYLDVNARSKQATNDSSANTIRSNGQHQQTKPDCDGNKQAVKMTPTTKPTKVTQPQRTSYVRLRVPRKRRPSRVDAFRVTPTSISRSSSRPTPTATLMPRPAPVLPTTITKSTPTPIPAPTPAPTITKNLPSYDSDKDSWALSRIRRRSKNLDTPAPELPANGGEGVHVWVIDVSFNQSQAGNFLYPPILEKEYVPGAGRYDPKSGHGTQVATCVSSWRFGVAKAAQLHLVALGEDGHLRDAIRFVTDRVREMENGNDKLQQRRIRHIIQLSVTFSEPNILDDEMREAGEAGIVVVNAAGNGADNACHYSPASSTRKMNHILTVGAIGPDDKLAEFSSRGPCVNMPVAKTSNVTKLVFGTSYAAPIASGVVALYLSQRHYSRPADVVQDIIRNASPMSAYSNSNELPGVVYAFPNIQ